MRQKKNEANIQSRPLCLRSLSAEELWGRDWANIQSSWPKKLDLSHGQKQTFMLCRVLLWTMTCSHWKLFSEWHGMSWFRSGQQAWFSQDWFSKISNAGPKKAAVKDRQFWWFTVHGLRLLKWKQKLFHLKQRGSPVYDTFAGNEVNQVGVSSLVFPLLHSHPKTCSHDSDILTERTAEQEWTRMKVLSLRVCSFPPPPLKIFWKDWHVLTNSLNVFNFCVKGARHTRQSESGGKLDAI